MTRAYQRKQLLWMVIGGALTGLTLVLPQIGFLQWLTMIPMMIGIYRLGEDASLSARRMYGYGFLTVFAYYLVIYHWFFNLYPLDFAGLSNASSIGVVLAGWIGLSLLQAILGGLVFLLYRLLGKTGIYGRHPFIRPFVFAALWTLFEWSSTVGWTGVPWGRLCLGQIECLPILQSASLLGSYFVSFMILLVNGLLAYAVLYRARATLCGTLAIASVGSMWAFGAVRLALPEKEDAIQIAVIQGNIDSHEKWDSSTGEKTKEIHARLTRAAAQEGAEIIVWSETAIPYSLNQNQGYRTYLSDLADECDVTIFVGAICKRDGKEYNAIYQVDPDGRIHEEIYAKRHLVPFGEYVPMRSLFTTFLPFLTEISMLEEDLTAGTDSNLFSVGENKIGGLICFDSIYEVLALDAARDGADLIALGTNDSWFRDSAAVYMHFSQARLRAIETGLPVARAANTGISGLITGRGEVVDSLPPLTEGYLAGSLSLNGGKTSYTTVGNLFVLLCAVFYFLALTVGFLTRKRRIAYQYKYF